MIFNLTPLLVLGVLAWGLHVLARRAWERMPLEKTPSTWSRSQARNRAGATVYYEGRPHIHRARYARRRTISEVKDI